MAVITVFLRNISEACLQSVRELTLYF